MRIGIYNRYWTTLGGGERHVGSMIDAVFSGSEVDLISVKPFDLESLREKLSLKLCNCRVVVWPDLSDNALVARTCDYDLFVNATYCSSLYSLATHSVYFTFFPHKRIRQVKSKFNIPRAIVISGSYEKEADGLMWTYPKSRWTFNTFRKELRIPFRRINPNANRDERIVVRSSGCLVVKADLDELIIRGVKPFISSITIEFPSYEPGVSDRRILGAPVDMNLLCESGGFREDDVNIVKLFKADFVRSYDTIIANSEYTRHWIKKRWRRSASILTPEINSPNSSRQEKEKRIISVGRFFPERVGSHNKKQDVLIRAFRTLCELKEVRDHWVLTLVGTMMKAPEDVLYLKELRHLAEGLPVEFHVDVDRSVLNTLYQKSYLFWQATGYGESMKSPELFEHFGITTCESMSYGCIPVVYDAGGQREIVETGTNGFRFRSIDELCEQSQRVIELYRKPESVRIANEARETALRYERLDSGVVEKLKKIIESNDQDRLGKGDEVSIP
ncbi:glycosyltransferase [Pelagicoccus sp. SDUM812003]|uniref:glycosyltransferase n=1 Tax=Pelagicoccus sp. SDUM812003 TaxID=3041267 RepID=UPI00280EC53C|nr:glycosyltransferase [Pelagicoccus sp. SDUM812003]MDQ8204250.1 glycosyltransferase [Pelagicoccus sp. SDUM812003]